MWKQYGDYDYILLLGAAEYSKKNLVPFLYLNDLRERTNGDST